VEIFVKKPIFIFQDLIPLFSNAMLGLIVVSLLSPELVGVYGASRLFLDALVQGLSLFSRHLTLGFASNALTFEKMRSVTFTVMLFGVVLVFCAQFVFNSRIEVDMLNGIKYTITLLLGVFGTWAYLMYGQAGLVLKGLEKNLMYITLISSSVGFIISFYLIDNFLVFGAFISLTLSRLLLGSLTYYSYKISA